MGRCRWQIPRAVSQSAEVSQSDVEKVESGKREAEMREIIERVTPKTWKRDKARLLELLAAG